MYSIADSDEILRKARAICEKDILLYKYEVRGASQTLNDRYTELRIQKKLGMGENALTFLYLLVRVTKPRIVVETGVANGDSTYYFLRV